MPPRTALYSAIEGAPSKRLDRGWRGKCENCGERMFREAKPFLFIGYGLCGTLERKQKLPECVAALQQASGIRKAAELTGSQGEGRENGLRDLDDDAQVPREAVKFLRMR